MENEAEWGALCAQLRREVEERDGRVFALRFVIDRLLPAVGAADRTHAAASIDTALETALAQAVGGFRAGFEAEGRWLQERLGAP